MINVAYLLSNPIQYQEPLLRELARGSSIHLTVLYRSRRSLESHSFTGFNIAAKWDIPLLEGYQYKFLKCLGSDKKFSFWRPFNYGLAHYLVKNKIKVLWIHGYKDAYLLYAIIIAKFLGIKVLVRGESCLNSHNKNLMKEISRNIFFKLLNNFVDGFLAIGSLNKSFYQYYKIPDFKIFTVPYTVDNKHFQNQSLALRNKKEELRQSLNLKHDWPILLYASSMMSRKRCEDLLSAFINLSVNGDSPKAYLIFIGDGERRIFLEKKIRSLNWDTVKILGFKNQTELPYYYALADIFVLPSENETWGLVVNEAMNASCAIIVSDQVGCREDLVKQNENGEIFEAKNIDALTDCLRRILNHPEKLTGMKSRSFEIINQWGPRETAKGLVHAIHTVMEVA